MTKTIMKPFIRLAAPLLLVTAVSQGQSQMFGFELQPQNQTVCKDDEAIFSAKVNTSLLSWKVDGVSLGSSPETCTTPGTKRNEHLQLIQTLTVSPAACVSNGTTIQAVGADSSNQPVVNSTLAYLHWGAKSQVYITSFVVQQSNQNITVRWNEPESITPSRYQVRIVDTTENNTLVAKQESTDTRYSFLVSDHRQGHALRYEVSFPYCDQEGITLLNGVRQPSSFQIYVQGREDSNFNLMPQNVEICLGEQATFEGIPRENAADFNWRMNGSFLSHFPDVFKNSEGRNGTLVDQLMIPYMSNFNNTNIQARISFADGSTPVVSPNARLTYRSANTTAYNTGVTAEPCDQGLCLSWPEPQTADGQPVYDKSYTLIVSQQNPNSTPTVLEQIALDSNSMLYTADSSLCHPLEFVVTSHYCGPSENVINISDQPEPALFTANLTKPEPVTALGVQPGCGQFYLSWNRVEPDTGHTPPVHYQVTAKQYVNDQPVAVECPGCEGLLETTLNFTPQADTPEQSRFQFTVTPGRCGQYRNDSIESEVHALTRCPETTQAMPFTMTEATEVSEQENAPNKSTRPQPTSDVVGLSMVIMALTTMLGL